MQRITQKSEWPKEWVGWEVVHLNILYAVLLEADLFKLPVEMIATVFKHVTEGDIFIRILKIVEDGVSQRHVNYVSEAIEIWSSADNDAAGP